MVDIACEFLPFISLSFRGVQMPVATWYSRMSSRILPSHRGSSCPPMQTFRYFHSEHIMHNLNRLLRLSSWPQSKGIGKGKFTSYDLVKCYLSSESCRQCSPRGVHSEELEVVQWIPSENSQHGAAQWRRERCFYWSPQWRDKSEGWFEERSDKQWLPWCCYHWGNNCSHDHVCPHLGWGGRTHTRTRNRPWRCWGPMAQPPWFPGHTCLFGLQSVWQSHRCW